SKGFHIYADVKEFDYSWDELKVVAKTIAEKMVKQNPKKYTIEFNKKDRGTKIFIDYLRNQRGATMVAPYSLRSKEGACISFPFAWDKLKNITPTFFTIKNYQRYL
ncbi:partial Multifunctional non-homologous end joining protein LigD, partial [Patescibacteria group bacterium]